MYYSGTAAGSTTFEFKADGTATYSAGTSANQPGPGPSGTGTYTVTGNMTPPQGTAYITWQSGSAQVLSINILEAHALVLDKRTIAADGSIATESRHFVR